MWVSADTSSSVVTCLPLEHVSIDSIEAEVGEMFFVVTKRETSSVSSVKWVGWLIIGILTVSILVLLKTDSHYVNVTSPSRQIILIGFK